MQRINRGDLVSAEVLLHELNQPDDRHDWHVGTSRLLAARGDWDGAIEHAWRALAANSYSGAAYGALVLADIGRDDLHGARTALGAGQAADPEHHFLHYAEAKLALARRQPGEAIGPLREAVTEAPPEMASLYRVELGQALLLHGEWRTGPVDEEAVSCFVEATIADPHWERAHVLALKNVHHRRNQWEEVARRALAHLPTSDAIRTLVVAGVVHNVGESGLDIVIEELDRLRPEGGLPPGVTSKMRVLAMKTLAHMSRTRTPALSVPSTPDRVVAA